jgi:predicted glutamine amidotransferase
MCKLAALINFSDLPFAIKSKVNKALDHLFFINAFGQTDGSGVMLMDNKGNVDYHKRAIPSPDFMETKWYDKQDLASNMFVGLHTRYATVGGQSDANAHPFEHDHIILMQNGTAGASPHHTQLVKGVPSRCTVDSDSVAHSIMEQGIDATLAVYRGAGVLMWLDDIEKSFNIIKNDQRTLHYAKVKDYDTVIIATDMYAIALAFARSGLDIEGDIQPVTNDQLSTFKIDKTVTKRPLKIIPYTPPAPKATVVGKPATPTPSTPRPTVVVGGSGSISKPSPKPKEQIYAGDCCNCGSPIFHGDEKYFYKGTDLSCNHCIAEVVGMLGGGWTIVDKGAKNENLK